MRMLSFTFCSLLLLGSCGVKENNGYRLGENRIFNPLVVDGAERRNLTQLCQALASKNARLPQMVGIELAFDVSNKRCEENNVSDPREVGVIIQRSGANFMFRQSNGLDFVYGDLETDTSGVMGIICQNMDELTSPMKTPNGSALWINTVGINESDCRATGQERCLQLVLGVPQGPDNFTVSSQEWIKFQIDPNRSHYGFFTERKTIAGSICGASKNTETRARLK